MEKKYYCTNCQKSWVEVIRVFSTCPICGKEECSRSSCRNANILGGSDILDPIPLAISMLEECDRWAASALSKYIHKEHILQTDLGVDTVYEHQQKIRIVIDKLTGNS